MPKLHSGKKIVKALKRIGFETVSQKGSQIKMRRIFKGNVYTVIAPDHKEVALGTFQSVLKQAGITKEELEENI
ncbi:hypothetical protein A3D07_02055 [Candidatus Curtissbacteria bacterium RIFCSPHIGHO2_02_FULL_42_15]|uniref:Addiction module toxin, HicA family n=1 Tax=Candidatus Curtissbacteria bacterium RIFCSPHIGHO2_02_FULL_42_15 TaxID=1797716 RepID=A0A1F5GH83_9BACT|nr:MAG: hypothetical protein A3D07_02055 [Candidatus Curtissbacteria bacterium RIFCSPHIGHO2_02_FULL_42_15]